MKREDITALFPEATQEQINKLMGINGTDINNARSNAETLQAQLNAANDKLKELQETAKELERLKSVETELTELKSANALRDMREKVSRETGIPMSMLTQDTEEACTAQANAIKEFAKPSSYPIIPDGGEPGIAGKLSTREQFSEWFRNLPQ